MAVIDQISKLGDLIISGQWGDVLFDLPKLSAKENLDNQTRFLFHKIVKPGGLFYQKNYGKNGVLPESSKKYYLIVLRSYY